MFVFFLRLLTNQYIFKYINVYIAFGNGAPDFFSLVASISDDNNILIAISALLGGGVFISTIVVGTIAIICPCEVSKKVFFRDLLFLLLSISIVLIFSLIHEITLLLSILLYIIYIIYIIIVILPTHKIINNIYNYIIVIITNNNTTSDSNVSGSGSRMSGSSHDDDSTIFGDIKLSRFDNNSIQTAFWHKDIISNNNNDNNNFDSKSNISNNINSKLTNSNNTSLSSSSLSPPSKSGYSFLILNDSDDDNEDNNDSIGGDDDDENNDSRNGDSMTINLTGTVLHHIIANYYYYAHYM